MKLKSYQETIALSKEKLDEALAAPRANRMKKKAEFEMAKIEEDIADKEAEVQELVTSKDIDFEELLNTLDEIALLERRKEQYANVIEQLFPKVKKKGKRNEQ